MFYQRLVHICSVYVSVENEDEFIEEAVTCTLIGCASILHCGSLNQVTRRRQQ